MSKQHITIAESEPALHTACTGNSSCMPSQFGDRTGFRRQLCTTISLPEHDRVFHIFNNKMIMANRCDKSPVNRNIFIVVAFSILHVRLLQRSMCQSTTMHQGWDTRHTPVLLLCVGLEQCPIRSTIVAG